MIKKLKNISKKVLDKLAEPNTMMALNTVSIATATYVVVATPFNPITTPLFAAFAIGYGIHTYYLQHRGEQNV